MGERAWDRGQAGVDHGQDSEINFPSAPDEIVLGTMTDDRPRRSESLLGSGWCPEPIPPCSIL